MSPPEQTTDLSTRPDAPYHDSRSSDPDADAKVTTSETPLAGLVPTSAPGDSQPPQHQLEVPAMAEHVETEDAPLVVEPKAEPTVQSSSVEAKGKQPELATPLPTDGGESMTGSMSTLKPARSTPPPSERSNSLSADPSGYVDPTPATPMASQPPSRTPSTTRSNLGDEQATSAADVELDETRYASEEDQEGQSGFEIKNIMEQFSAFGGGPGADEVMSPRLEITSPTFSPAPSFSPAVQHPPRKSSLEPVSPAITSQIQDFQALRISTASPESMPPKDRGTEDQGPPVPPKDSGTPARSMDDLAAEIGTPISPVASKHRPPPPEPEPEPSLPFDFHRFLEQLRNKKADPVARYLKSFLAEFGKKQWMVHEQVKIISDFLAFIANKMAMCEVWRDVSDAEFDNAREGMEKLVMNRLYTQTFSPTIPPPKPIPGAKPKRRGGGDIALGPGRRGQHQEDVERDDILTQKINIYAWVREEHLDIPEVGDSGRRFLKLAQQELLKIKSYRAPRDKIICVLNCCKVIFGLLKHNKSDSSADSFMPLLIYVVLQSNPEHLVSNVQYILRFRNQDKLGGEAGYYLSSLMGAIQFIENMDRTTLTITDDEFEKNVEAAVSSIAEKHRIESPRMAQEPVFNEKGHPPAGPSGSRTSYDGQDGPAGRGSTSMDDPNSESAAIAGILKTFQKPLSSIGRMFTDEGSQHGGHPPQSSTGPSLPPRSPTLPPPDHSDLQRPSSRHTLSAEEAAARQASAEAAEAQRLHRAEHTNIVETLAGMFPDLDRDIISDVVYQKEGRVGLAVDACLALST